MPLRQQQQPQPQPQRPHHWPYAPKLDVRVRAGEVERRTSSDPVGTGMDLSGDPPPCVAVEQVQGAMRDEDDDEAMSQTRPNDFAHLDKTPRPHRVSARGVDGGHAEVMRRRMASHMGPCARRGQRIMGQLSAEKACLIFGAASWGWMTRC